MTKDIKDTILSALELYRAKGVFFDEKQSLKEIDNAIEYINSMKIDKTDAVQVLKPEHVRNNEKMGLHQLSIDELLE